MARSMTGYGSHELACNGKCVFVEIKSVNHRFLDISVKTSRALGHLENIIRKIVQTELTRGKVEVYAVVESADVDNCISVNLDVAKMAVDALQELKSRFNLDDTIKLEHLLRVDNLFKLEQKADDQAVVSELLAKATTEALKSITASREREGEALVRDLHTHCNAISEIASLILRNHDLHVAEYRQRLFDKITELLDGVALDESRLLSEVAFHSEKTDVNEEVVRIMQHIDELLRTLESGSPIGKRLDFIVQEMNREANTIASKTANIDTIKLSVDLKCAIEKIKEQVQNIE